MYRRRNLENQRVRANDNAKYDIVSKKTPSCLECNCAPQTPSCLECNCAPHWNLQKSYI